MKLVNFTFSTVVFLVLSFPLMAQVGINTNSPADGTILDIDSTNKGILIPKVSLSGKNSLTSISLTGPTLEEGTLVYNTAKVTGVNAIDPGFHYWNGVDTWIALGNDKDWSLSGNTITATDRLGTNNSQPLIIKTNGSDRVRVETGGQVRSVGDGSESSPTYSFVDSPNSGLYLRNNNELNLTSNGNRFFTLLEFGASRQATINPDGDSEMNTQIRGDSGVILNAHPTKENVQIGANSNPDYASLSLAHSTKGFLPNRVGLVGLSTVAPIVSTPLEGLLVWNRGSLVTEGMYFWQNSRWRRILNASESLVPTATNTYNIGSGSLRYSTIYLQNVPNISSDRRLKNTITSLDSALPQIKKLAPVSYFLNTDTTSQEKHFGFIAQEVKEVYPNLVTENEEGILAMKYTELIPVLTQGIKEQQKIIENQNSRINMLEEKIKQIETLLKK